jgi:hypothetical protein
MAIHRGRNACPRNASEQPPAAPHCARSGGEFVLRNRVREMRTLGSVRGAVAAGYGEPKRARSWKRRIQPRGYLRTSRGLLFSEEAGGEYEPPFREAVGRRRIESSC